MSIEVISPPRRPITCSVSAKRAADEMELEDTNTLFISSSPRPRKVRKVTGASGMFASRCWQRLLTLQQNFQARSRCLRAPKAPSRSRRTVPPALLVLMHPPTSTRIISNRRTLGKRSLHTFDPISTDSNIPFMLAPLILPFLS